MDITYEFRTYAGSTFTDEKENKIAYLDIKDNFYKLNGRIGKIIHKGCTSVYEQGFTGGYNSYGFVFQDDLSNVSLQGKIILKAVVCSTSSKECSELGTKIEWKSVKIWRPNLIQRILIKLNIIKDKR